MPKKHRTLTCHSPMETILLAETLAEWLRPGDVVLLDGGLGAGKTHFARGVIQALLVTPEEVPSPTFTLVQMYQGKSCEIWHADLYRLTDETELDELGLSAAFEEAICLIEWPDRIGSLIPRSAMTVAFEAHADDDTRIIRFSWDDVRWDSVAGGLTFE